MPTICSHLTANQGVLQGYFATQCAHCFSLDAIQQIMPQGKHMIAQSKPGIE